MRLENRWQALARDKQEQIFIGQIVDWCGRAVDGRPVLTGFLDPGQRRLLARIASEAAALAVDCWGGFPEAERCRCVIRPAGDRREPDWSILALIVTPPDGIRIAHRDLLGALLGLGLERERIGDIVLRPDDAVVLADAALHDLLTTQLVQVHRYPVRVAVADPDTLALAPPPEQPRTVVAASLRLDAVVAAAFNLSRTAAVRLIDQERVSVNWRPETRRHLTLKPDDVVAVRGHGRFRVVAGEGETRKGRVKVTLAYPGR